MFCDAFRLPEEVNYDEVQISGVQQGSEPVDRTDVVFHS
jgi:hypothetical protein